MITLRWSTLVLFTLSLGLVGCGGAADASKDPSAAPLIQARADRIEQLKKRSAKPGRAAARPGPKLAGKP